MTEQTATPILKRRVRAYTPRTVAFVDCTRSQWAYEGGPVHTIRAVEQGQYVPLGDVLRLASDKAESVYIVGGWNAASTPVSAWFQAPDGWERVTYHRSPLIASYKRQDGRRVTLYSSAQWFGECDDISLIRATYIRLRVLLRATFDNDLVLMGTPARTGLDLIERSLSASVSFPTLAQDVRTVIENNIGQGRLEMLAHTENTPQVDTLYVLDAIWMYSACCRRLPCEPVEHDYQNTFAGWRSAFYRVQFQVPPAWAHIGLLPTWHPKQHRTVWPSKPSEHWYEAFVGPEELKLAIENGWPVRIAERWLFREGDDIHVDPLRYWIEKLRALREMCTDEREGQKGPLLRGAIRALCIKAVGGLHRKGRFQHIETPIEDVESIPDDAEILYITDTHCTWRKPIPLDSAMAQFAHPEWSAAIWGRARARLAKAALQLPRETIIALRSDAIVTTFDPGWHGEKPGEFRLKETLDLGGQLLPRRTSDYLQLRRANKLEADEEGEE